MKIVISIISIFFLAFCETPTTFRDGLGDFLIAPAFIASSGVKTELKLTNVNPNSSFLIRAVVMDRVHHNEVNFLIMLAPFESWEATIDNGIIKSSSDANFNKKALLSGVDLNAIYKEKKEVDFGAGYIEFYPFVQFKQKIQNRDLKQKYYDILSGDTNMTRSGGADGNSLFGLVTLRSSDNKSATLKMLAYKGAVNQNLIGKDASPKATTDPTIYIGSGNIEDIYKDLQSREVNVPFINGGAGTKLIITFWNDRSKNQKRSLDLSIFLKNSDYKKTVQKELIDGTNIIDINLWLDYFVSKKSKGLARISNIKNINDSQLGKNSFASLISTILQTSKIDGKISIDNWFYAPSSGF